MIFIEWDENPAQYIVNALSPAKVVSISACDDENGKKATVVVSDQQLSLAIGKAGQNVRLAAKLTGYGIVSRVNHRLKIVQSQNQMMRQI